jgi:pimeloyl-ACP methyl ester carboxylesterase
MTQLYSEDFSGDSDLLVLLHGLGATSDVWSPFVAARPGRFWLKFRCKSTLY